MLGECDEKEADYRMQSDDADVNSKYPAYELNYEMHIDISEMLDNIVENSYVAIRAPPNSVELFYVMKVLKKAMASENMSDPKKPILS